MVAVATSQAEVNGLLALDQYWIWLREHTTHRVVGDWIEITTPYLDRHNDCLQIYARRDQGGWLLTDDGHVIDDLDQLGYGADSALSSTLAGLGVQIDDGSLVVKAAPAEFAPRMHNLLQAMLAASLLAARCEP